MAQATVRPDDEIRVFIAYSHANAADVVRLAEFLEDEVHVRPVFDRNLPIGRKFDDEIRRQIAHSHVFMPVLTVEAVAGKWVHQEIGCAIALDVPVLPLSVGHLPGEMIYSLHAVEVDFGNMATLGRVLSRDRFDTLTSEKNGPVHSCYRCASLPEDRAAWLAQYCDDVVAMEAFGRLRQKGGLSSLHIPREVPSNPVWNRRYLPTVRSDDHKRKQHAERIALERHAREAGCRLIINPDLAYPDLCAEAVATRLETLVAFLSDMGDAECEVAFNVDMGHNDSVTIVGNWFSAESVHGRRGAGYYQTIFTRHAPCLAAKISAFDSEFDDLLKLKSGWNRGNSRIKAIEFLSDRLEAVRRLPRNRMMPGPSAGAATDPHSVAVLDQTGMSLFRIPDDNHLRQQRVSEMIDREVERARESASPPAFDLLASSGFSYVHPNGPVWKDLGLGRAMDITGARLRVVLESPFSEFAITRALANGVNRHHWEHKVLLSGLEDLVQRYCSDVRVTSLPVNCSLFLTPDSVLYDPYLWARPLPGRSTENNFLVAQFMRMDTPSDCYSLLRRHFDFIFDHSVSLATFLQEDGDPTLVERTASFLARVETRRGMVTL